MAGARPSVGTLVERLQARRGEIEAAVLTRVYSVSDPTEAGDSEYVAGLRAAVSAALDHALDALVGGDPRSEEIPPELIAQARYAVRNGVSLDTVLRRYFAGYTLVCDYLLEESERGELLQGAALKRALRSEAALFDRIVTGVTDAYTGESEGRMRTAEQRRAERVKKLLAGDPVDPGELDYELGDWHLGVVAVGPGVPGALRELAGATDRRLLLVRPGGETVWGWLGGRQRVAAEDLARRAHGEQRAELQMAIGEPGHGVSGWRLTHQQARAAFPIAARGEAAIVSYSEVAIVASVLGDEVLTSSLSELYLAPLADERDGGAVLRETLRAYFTAGRNAASAAAALGVSRQTVNSRLHTVEERTGRQLTACGTELETALQLWDLGST